MTPRLPLLLVGYGVRGRQWDRAVRRNRFPLAGVVDPDPRAREGVRGSSWPSLQEALSASGARAAIIASPSEHHADDAVACLEAGLAVMVEKPLALSAADARRVVQAAESAARPALVGQNFRYLPREVAVRRLLDRGAIGAPGAGTIVSARSLPGVAQRAGGVLYDFVLQHLDALRDRYGGTPATVAAEADGSGSEWLIRLAWAGGPRVVYHHREGGPGYHFHERVEGPDGAIVISDAHVRLLPRGRRARRVPVRTAPTPERAILEQLAAAEESGRTGPLGVEDNLATVDLVEAVARSAAEGRSVTLETSPPSEVRR
jgi:predicted dehydrogenase